MNSVQTRNSVTFYFMKNSFSDVSRKWIFPNMIRAVNQSQFTPKMKANAVSRLLSSLVWIDQYTEYDWALPVPVIFGKIHFLLTSENEFFLRWNVTELQVCMEFMFIRNISNKTFPVIFSNPGTCAVDVLINVYSHFACSPQHSLLYLWFISYP